MPTSSNGWLRRMEAFAADHPEQSISRGQIKAAAKRLWFLAQQTWIDHPEAYSLTYDDPTGEAAIRNVLDELALRAAGRAA